MAWIQDRVDDVQDSEAAIQILQNMINRKLICHASGNQDFPFHNGHHLYFIFQHGSYLKFNHFKTKSLKCYILET